MPQICEGVLFKWSKYMMHYRKRFCRLECNILYNSKRENSRKREEIRLYNAKIIGSRKSTLIRIYTENRRRFYFKAETQSQSQIWIEQLQKAAMIESPQEKRLSNSSDNTLAVSEKHEETTRMLHEMFAERKRDMAAYRGAMENSVTELTVTFNQLSTFINEHFGQLYQLSNNGSAIRMKPAAATVASTITGNANANQFNKPQTTTTTTKIASSPNASTINNISNQQQHQNNHVAVAGAPPASPTPSLSVCSTNTMHTTVTAVAVNPLKKPAEPPQPGEQSNTRTRNGSQSSTQSGALTRSGTPVRIATPTRSGTPARIRTQSGTQTGTQTPTRIASGSQAGSATQSGTQTPTRIASGSQTGSATQSGGGRVRESSSSPTVSIKTSKSFSSSLTPPQRDTQREAAGHTNTAAGNSRLEFFAQLCDETNFKMKNLLKKTAMFQQATCRLGEFVSSTAEGWSEQIRLEKENALKYKQAMEKVAQSKALLENSLVFANKQQQQQQTHRLAQHAQNSQKAKLPLNKQNRSKSECANASPPHEALLAVDAASNATTTGGEIGAATATTTLVGDATGAHLCVSCSKRMEIGGARASAPISAHNHIDATVGAGIATSSPMQSKNPDGNAAAAINLQSHGGGCEIAASDDEDDDTEYEDALCEFSMPHTLPRNLLDDISGDEVDDDDEVPSSGEYQDEFVRLPDISRCTVI